MTTTSGSGEGGSLRPMDRRRRPFAVVERVLNPENPAVREVFHEACVPALSDDGRIVREVIIGHRWKGECGRAGRRDFGRYPDRFEYDEDAVNFVRDVLESYGETVLRVED